MNAFLQFIIDNPFFTLLGAITIIQISPIKVDPWKWIFKQIRGFIIGDVETIMVADIRWHILDFSNTCIWGRRHTKEEWVHCLDQLAWYEDYCKKNNVRNGVMPECASHLRKTFKDLNEKGEFLHEAD